MKKLVSLLLAMMMVASLFTVAFAADPFTSFVGEDVDLYDVANLSTATIDDDPRAVHTQYLAQHFIPAQASLSGVKLRLKYGGGEGVMHLEVREGDANGQAVFTVDVPVKAQGNVCAWYTFDFGQTITLTPGEKYALTFWFVSKTTNDFCIAIGSYQYNEGLDLWRHKRFEYAGGSDPYGTLYEERDLPLKTTERTVGFELLTPDQMAAYGVDTLIANLPKTIKVEHEQVVNEALAAYEGLTDAQKGYVMNFDLLNAALDALATAKAQYAIDLEEATRVQDQINALPSPTDVTWFHQEKIQEVEGLYNALTKNQKAMVSAQAVEKLQEVKAAVTVAVDRQAAQKAEELLALVPTPTDVTSKQMVEVVLALSALDELTAAQKGYLSQSAVEKAEALNEIALAWNQMGDVNGDEQVNAKDALETLKITVNKVTPTALQTLTADVNEDRKVDAKDALEILKFVVAKPSALNGFYSLKE